MKPLEVSLSGFGSYREPQTIDFTPVRLACITGPNGAGKSSLLDAISWSLLGITRTGDIDLVVNDQSDRAEVSFTFEQDGVRWRVTRIRTKGKKTSARLEREEDGAFVPVEAGGVRAVDAEIHRLIRISAETFASTVLLAQGGSGRFAKASPRERKRVLAEILGLDRYDPLAKGARERARADRASFEFHRQRVDELSEQLRDADADTEALNTAKVRLAALAEEVAQVGADLAGVEGTLATHEQTTERIAQLDRQLTAARAARQTRTNAAREVAAASGGRVTKAKAALWTLQDKVTKAEEAAGSIEATEARLVAAHQRETDLAGSEEEITGRGIAARTTSERAQEEIARLGAEKADAEDRLRLLGHDESECFTCGQHLDAGRRRHLLDRETEKLESLAASIEAAGARQGAAESARANCRTELAVCRKARQEAEDSVRQLGGSLEVLKDRAAARTEFAEQLPAAAADVATMERVAEESEAALRAIEQDTTVEDIAGELSSLRSSIADVEALPGRREGLRHRCGELEAERDRLNQRIGQLRDRVEGADKLRRERQRQEDAAQVAARDAEDHAQLARAFGPDGVPNLVFGGVVAELEADVSQFMENLTDGRFRLELRTEREAKVDGEMIETLDVMLVTATGERPYVALSGGEQFRVDLALAVGLTHLLIRRSGCPIDFLALDEGWGALDPAGITAALATLRGLHDEFSLILTITHTPEVAAAFEARIEVEMDADGTSAISLVAA